MNDAKILVTLDGSKFAERALPIAIEVATNISGSLNLVSVSTNRPQGWRGRVETVVPGDLNRADPDRSKYLETVAKRIEAVSDTTVICNVLFGSLDEAIVDYSAISNPTIIAMSTHGRGPISRSWFGSVADRVARHVPMPVVLVRPEVVGEVDLSERHGIRNILIALDGSRRAEESLDYVKAICSSETACTLVRIVGESVPAHTVDAMCTPLNIRDFTKIGNTRVTNYLIHVERLMNNGNRKVESVVVDGVPAAVGILNTAAEKGADVIAMTTHGRGVFPRVVFGSVTDEVVRSSHLPVLVVHPKTN